MVLNLVNDLNELARKSLDLWSILRDSSSFGNGSVIDNLPTYSQNQEVYFQSTIDLRKSNIVVVILLLSQNQIAQLHF